MKSLARARIFCPLSLFYEGYNTRFDIRFPLSWVVVTRSSKGIDTSTGSMTIYHALPDHRRYRQYPVKDMGE